MSTRLSSRIRRTRGGEIFSADTAEAPARESVSRRGAGTGGSGDLFARRDATLDARDPSRLSFAAPANGDARVPSDGDEQHPSSGHSDSSSSSSPLRSSQASEGNNNNGRIRAAVAPLKLVLQNHFLFSGMGDDDLQRICEKFEVIDNIPAGNVVIEEGAKGDFFYVVRTGTLGVIQSSLPGKVDTLEPGRVFGELALIYESPRAATVLALSETSLWSLSRHVFREMVTNIANKNLDQRSETLRKISAFAKLTNEQLRRVAAVMQEERFPPGTQICYQGETLVPGVNDKFYTISSGRVMVTAAPLLRRGSKSKMLSSSRNSPSTAKLNELVKDAMTPPPVPSSPGGGGNSDAGGSSSSAKRSKMLLESPSSPRDQQQQQCGDNTCSAVNGTAKSGGSTPTSPVSTTTINEYLSSPHQAASSSSANSIAGGNRPAHHHHHLQHWQSSASSGDSAALAGASESLVPLDYLGPGDWFGEMALMSDAPRSANIISLGNMGGEAPPSSQFPGRGGLSSSPAPPSIVDMKRLLDEPASSSSSSGSGSTNITTNSSSSAMPSLATASVMDTVCLTLSRGAFEQIISPSYDQLATISGASEARKADNHERKWRHRIDDTAADISLDSLIIGDVIGEGGFSVVRWAKHKVTGEVFALKTMSKKTVAERKQVSHVNNERKILSEVSHPFVLSLIKAFADANRLYMVLEFLPGGELFSRVLKSGGGLPNAHAAFYGACVLEGLSYLHRKGIVYRDLKLENLVIDIDGYLKIVDFGFAKQIPPGSLTRTLCGTPDYLAPECVTRQGHNFAVDCWGFGVLMYEMLTQFSPFADATGTGNRVIVFQNIIKGIQHVDWNELARPFRLKLDRMAADGTLDADAIRRVNQEFAHIQNLLYLVWDPNPLTRISSSNIKHHPYFGSFNWSDLREMTLPAPWVPELKDTSDLSYFEVESYRNVREPNEPYVVDKSKGEEDLFKDFAA